LARKPADQSVNREDILFAAADVLRRNGYEATTMKDIAAEVNLTAASLYHHYKNKDALLLAVMEAGLERVISQIEPVVQSNQPAAEKLRAMIRVHVTNLTSNTAVGAAMIFEIRPLMALRSDNGDADIVARRDAFFAQRDHFERLYRQVVQEGIDSGDFRQVDVPVFTRAMLGAHNWVGVWFRESGPLSGEQIADMMADTFLHALEK
jgi:AcrR family transcriptional regulator